MIHKLTLSCAAVAVLLVLGGCSIFDAAGDSVEAVGEGAGHAVEETGRGAGHIVSETGRAISRSSREIERDIED